MRTPASAPAIVRVVKVLAAVGTQMHGLPIQRILQINGQPGVVPGRGRTPDQGQTLDIVDGVVQAVRSIINPEAPRRFSNS
jgi:hypothetical protein